MGNECTVQMSLARLIGCSRENTEKGAGAGFDNRGYPVKIIRTVAGFKAA